MKSAIRMFLLLSIGILLSVPVQSQVGMGMRPPDIAGVFNPSVGSGSSYELIKKDNGEKTVFDMSVVDKDPSGGYWVEYGVQNPKLHGPMYMKELMTRKDDDVMIEHMIVQVPGQPPMDMSTMMSMKGMQSKNAKADFRNDAENLGTESITTPAGTFSCQHWRSKKDGTDVWLSDKVSPWKLVKMNDSTNTMTLVRTISDAKTHITETPVSMQEMMQQRKNK